MFQLLLLLLELALAVPVQSLDHSILNYHEKLDLTPLTSSSLLASFQFGSNVSARSYKQQHFDLFPRSLGQILQHSNVQNLHLRFSSGRWKEDSWGSQPHNGRKEGGTGVEIWARINAESEEQSYARWTTLNHALSGLFCASLNFIDSTRTTSPYMTFDDAYTQLANHTNSYLLHGALPREVVCTENLTPFLKLLPCKGSAGIASLLDGHRLFDATWQTMAIDVVPICRNIYDQHCDIHISQSVDMVLDVSRSKRARGDPIPRPGPRENLRCNTTKSYSSEDACFPADTSQGQSWTLAEIFGRPLQGSCLVSDEDGPHREAVCLYVPSERETIYSGNATQSNYTDPPRRCFNLLATESFDIVLSHLGPQTFNPTPSSLLTISRAITGHGQERGGIKSLLSNRDPTRNVELIYFESLPWFMKPFLSTLRTHIAGSTGDHPNPIQRLKYRSALDRKRGSQLEIALSIPAQSTLILTYEFEKAFLRYTEYPPDANRGFDVPPAIIRLTKLGQRPLQPRFIRTTNLLLSLPTPDFSMPYNVIILTSTVIALAFGSIYNLLVRRFVAADEVEAWQVSDLKSKVRGRLRRLFQKFAKVETDKKTQ